MRRLILRTAIFFLVAGGARRVYKLRRKDAARVEQETGKPASEMTEKELKAAMKRLRIRELEVAPEDQEEVTASFCPHCGEPIEKDDRFCVNCGASVY
ncbi:MAG: zinc ribbon domain-containing protein [Promethearchaeota archaeon]